MKHIMIIFFSAFILIGMVHPALAADFRLNTSTIEAVDLNELNSFIKTLDLETQNLLPRFDLKSWGVTGPEWDFAKIGRNVLAYFLRELVFNFRLLGELLLLAMALALLQNMRHAFESETVNQIAFSLCFLVVMGLVIKSFSVTFLIAREALQQMTNFMYAIIPLLFSLIAAGGGVATTAIVHPILISSIGLIGGLMSDLVFPLILFAGVLGLVNFLVDGFQINKLANLLKSAAIGLMGLAMAVFIGIITIRGFAGSIADSTALRTAKYVSNTFLPVVGGALSDTMEMAVGCSMVLKGGLGIFGLGLVVLIIVFPLIKILALAVIYQLSGAVIQPLGNTRLADALQTVGATFFNLFAAVAIVGLMFFIALAILVGAANFRTV
ncbi:MAG TPA: stage III sporulation protein AE [Firmicutes bacterium]|jgi:stage III sporulation protein AE|nr:stage III sporulation protein AE [Bacillota bacterium]